MDTLDYENVVLLTGGYGRTAGRVKCATSGIAFKDTATNQITTVRSEDLSTCRWYRSQRGYQARLQHGEQETRLDGFTRENMEELEAFFKKHYPSTMTELQDLDYRGRHFGTLDLANNTLIFAHESKRVMEIPMNQITNTLLTGKNEIALELNTTSSGAHKKDDVLVEMRFFVPEEGEADGDEDAQEDKENKEKPASAAERLLNAIKAAAELTTQQGDAIVSFPELPCLTPRGRFEVDLYPSFMRLRGKTYDYKIMYQTILRLFLLPKPDDLHVLFVMQLDPPIRQGQTRYPFLVFQFAKDEEMEVSLNLDAETLKTQYPKLKESYDAPTFEVVSQLCTALSDRPVQVPNPQLFSSVHATSAVKCAYKANEGLLYPLDRMLLFLPKPAMVMLLNDIATVQLSRVGSSALTARSFDVKVFLRSGQEHQFSNIPKEELPSLDAYLKSKKISIKNELNFDERPTTADFYESESSSNEDDAEPRGSGEESSVDEDFKADDSDSSVAEEYDEEYDSDSGSDDASQSGSESENEESGSDTEKEQKVKKQKVEKKKPVKTTEPKQSKEPKEPKTKEKKGKKEKKPAPAIKKPLSAFILFSNSIRADMKQRHPNASFAEMGKLMSEEWRTVAADVKKKYQDEADQLKAEYQRKVSELGAATTAATASSSNSKQQFRTEDKMQVSDSD